MNMIYRWINNYFSVDFIFTNIKEFFIFILKPFFILSFAFSFIIISVNLTLLFKPLYYMDINILNIEEASNLSKEEIKVNYDYVITYLTQSKKEEFILPTLNSSANGKTHFEEVKIIFDKLKLMLLLSTLISIIGIILNKKYKTVDYLLTCSIILIIIPIILLIPFLINFDKSFTLFHRIFFKNNYWLFDIRYDPIIKILPQNFFFHCALLILTLIIMSSIVLRYIYKVQYKKLNFL